MARADAAMYARVFGQGEGEIILEDLIRRYAVKAKTSGGIDAILQTYHNAGARDVLEFITLKVNQANGVTDDAPE